MKFILTLILVSFSAKAQLSKPLVQADISRMADTAHVEFRGLKNWRYDLRRDGGRSMVLTVAPMDDASISKLENFSDPHVESVSVKKTGPDGDFEVTFNLADANVESFDYLTEDPSRLIIDFYKKQEEKKPSPVATSAGGVKSEAYKKVAKKSPKGKVRADGYEATAKPNRRPAGDEFINVPAPAKQEANDVSLSFGIFDGSDDNYDRFRIKDYEIREDAIIASRQNVYLPFPMLKMPIPVLDQLLDQQPEFVIRDKTSAENKEARLLLRLFERGRYGLYLKTYDHFVRTYPDSEYMEIVKNVTAHVYLRRWLKDKSQKDFDKAQAMLVELVQRYPTSPLREYNHLLLGFTRMEHGEAVPTMQTFLEIIKEHPKSSEMPQVRKGLSEAYVILRKYDEATAQLQAIINDFPRTEHAREARYRLGDVYFAKGDYNQSLKAYEAALKELPNDEKIYPNAHFNMAEAHFWQKDYKNALDHYVKFVSLFPTNSHGGYALTRAGELLGIMGADQRRVMGAFLESYFRFPEHPGAKVARIRMLSQQMRGMKPNELKKALLEIKNAAKKVDLPGMEEFTTVMAAEGLTNRGEFRPALSHLLTYYQRNPASTNAEQVRSRVRRNIANELKANVETGDFMKALEFYSQYKGTWLNNSDRIDVPYFVGGAYEAAGAYGEAAKIFQQARRNRLAIVGTQTEKEKKVNEHLPSVDSLNLRLAAVLVQERNFIEAYQSLKAIGDGGTLSPEENIERVQLSATIAEQRNDFNKARDALMELAKRWRGDAALLAPVHLQLAETFIKLDDPKKAEFYATQALKAEGGETPIAEKVVASSLKVKGDALLAQKKDLAAVEAYQKLLERFEDKMPLASVRYKVGQILYNRGDLRGAGEVWKRLEGTPNEFLYKVGREKLQDSEWKMDYEKYTRRIPAMSKETK